MGLCIEEDNQAIGYCNQLLQGALLTALLHSKRPRVNTRHDAMKTIVKWALQHFFDEMGEQAGGEIVDAIVPLIFQ